MNLLKIVEGVGEGIISNVVPGGGAIVSAINAFLPDDKKLPDNATGSQATAAAQNLTPEQRTQLESQELDLQKTAIEQVNQTMRVEAASSDPYVSHARPTMTYIVAWTLGLEIVGSIIGGLYGILMDPAHATEIVTAIGQLNGSLQMPMGAALAVIGVYVRSRSTHDKVLAAGKSPAPGIIQSLIGAIKSK